MTLTIVSLRDCKRGILITTRLVHGNHDCEMVNSHQNYRLFQWSLHNTRSNKEYVEVDGLMTDKLSHVS